MVSAVLPSQNESSWAHMGNTPYPNSHLNSNPRPNPKKKQKQFHPSAANGVSGRFRSFNNNVDSPAVTQTASDDAYSFNQISASRIAGNRVSNLTFNVATYKKSELLELRKRLLSELDQIRDLRDRVDSGQFNISENPRSQSKLKKFSGSKRPGYAIGSAPKKLGDGRENGSVEAIDFRDLLKECEKIVGKLIKHKFGYVFRTPVDAVALKLQDYHQIVKHPMDLGTVRANLAKNLYRTPVEFAADVRLTFNNALLYNPKTDPVNGMAEELLSRFEQSFKPVQERFDGMLKKQLEDRREFRINGDLPFREVVELQESPWNNHSNQVLAKKKSKPKTSPVPVAHTLKKPERLRASVQAHCTDSTPSNPPLPMMNQPLPATEPFPPSPVRDPPILASKDHKAGRVMAPRQPKPRAKDPNKRDMSMDEKQKLGMGLQDLPQEKLPQLVQIIRRRNEHLAQDGDEIELDIETLDRETLWELDRFVANWKKMASKTKRQAMFSNNPASEVPVPSSPNSDVDVGGTSDNQDDDSGKKMKDYDEDVDIDDDMPASSFPTAEIDKDEGLGGGVVEINKDEGVNVGVDGGIGGHDRDQADNGGGGNGSSSSSSSGGSSSDSSSSDSDSGSSSGCEPDADDAQS